VSTRPVPPVFVGFLDDAAVFPPGNAPLPGAVAAHREHRAAWYAAMVGPLLVPPEDVTGVPADIEIGVVGPLGAVADVITTGRPIRQFETAVAKRGEDPEPGLREALTLIAKAGIPGYVEIPLTWGLTGALDIVVEARATGIPVAPKFRTGGLAAELFPSPTELAAVICACRDRGLPFKLTAGLHHAIRHIDPETHIVHHGFLNVLAAAFAAADRADPAAVASVLASTDAVPLVNTVRPHLDDDRPLWTGFGSCSIGEPLADLRTLGILGASS
jgi:hypothetical protein